MDQSCQLCFLLDGTTLECGHRICSDCLSACSTTTEVCPVVGDKCIGNLLISHSDARRFIDSYPKQLAFVEQLRDKLKTEVQTQPSSIQKLLDILSRASSIGINWLDHAEKTYYCMLPYEIENFAISKLVSISITSTKGEASALKHVQIMHLSRAADGSMHVNKSVSTTAVGTMPYSVRVFKIDEQPCFSLFVQDESHTLARVGTYSFDARPIETEYDHPDSMKSFINTIMYWSVDTNFTRLRPTSVVKLPSIVFTQPENCAKSLSQVLYWKEEILLQAFRKRPELANQLSTSLDAKLSELVAHLTKRIMISESSLEQPDNGKRANELTFKLPKGLSKNWTYSLFGDFAEYFSKPLSPVSVTDDDRQRLMYYQQPNVKAFDANYFMFLNPQHSLPTTFSRSIVLMEWDTAASSGRVLDDWVLDTRKPCSVSRWGLSISWTPFEESYYDQLPSSILYF